MIFGMGQVVMNQGVTECPRRDSNTQPAAPEAAALSNCATGTKHSQPMQHRLSTISPSACQLLWQTYLPVSCGPRSAVPQLARIAHPWSTIGHAGRCAPLHLLDQVVAAFSVDASVPALQIGIGEALGRIGQRRKELLDPKTARQASCTAIGLRCEF